jgi:hypothetical protein
MVNRAALAETGWHEVLEGEVAEEGLGFVERAAGAWARVNSFGVAHERPGQRGRKCSRRIEAMGENGLCFAARYFTEPTNKFAAPP